MDLPQQGGLMRDHNIFFNPTAHSIALRKAKIAYNFGLSECSRVYENYEKTIFLHHPSNYY